VGLIARHVEAAGISTLCMSSALDVTRAVNPPRAAFLDFPLGHTTGPPHDRKMQQKILLEALEGFSSLLLPGKVKALQFHWAEDDSWKVNSLPDEDGRIPRFDTPQYQNEEDRQRANKDFWLCTKLQQL